MDVLKFAEKYLGEFKIRGKEVNIKKCPYCGKEKWKFYINKNTGLFKCQSGSCQASGGFFKIQHKFGIKVKFKESITNIENGNTDGILHIDKQKQLEFKVMTDEMYDWWNKRGISKGTLHYMNVCRWKEYIALPYLQENELKIMKYRNMDIGKDKKVWQEPGGIPVLWGIDKIDYNEPIILTEGEPDMLSWIEAGFKNVVSVPFGTSNLDWINNNLDFIEKIKIMYICFDSDVAGEKAIKNIQARLNKMMQLKKINIGTYNDVNEAYMAEGKDKLIEFYEFAEYFKENGYHYGEDIEVATGVPEATGFLESLDVNTGGFKFGEVVVWSAYTGCGKTTILSQMALKDISLGYNVCYYTGEDSKEDIMTKIALQLYGKSGTNRTYNKLTKEMEEYPTIETAKKIKAEIGKKIIILEDEAVLTDESLNSKMQAALTKDNCRIFIIDNLMQIDILKKSDENKNDMQKNFVRGLVRFARKNNIQIHLVAHNKKPEGNNSAGKTYDVSGASEIVNLANMVIGIDKLSKKRKDELFEKGLGEADAMLKVLKKRKRQGKGGVSLLKFCNDFATFYNSNDNDPERLKIEIDDDLPELFRGD